MSNFLYCYVLCCVDWLFCIFFFFQQKTAYELRISDWSSDVCSSDLDGAESTLRQLAGGEVSRHDYGQRGAVAYIETGQPHEDTAWQRFLPTGPDRKSGVEGKSVSVRVDPGGSRIITKKRMHNHKR